MKTKYVMACIVAGVLVAAVAGISLSSQATAQMGDMPYGQHGTMSGQNTIASSAMHHSKMFSGSGSSAVSNVAVTGIAVTGEKEATVYLRHTGTGAAPSVVIVVHTNKMEMMSMMHGGMSGIAGMQGMEIEGLGSSSMGSMSAMHGAVGHGVGMNSTSTTQQTSGLLVGSKAVDAGWRTGTVKIMLQGDSVAYDAHDIMAMVFPLTS